MIDLHTHTLFSDGELIPAELARRAEHKGIRLIGMTDHGDMSNIDLIIPRIVEAARILNAVSIIRIVPGIEITHVPPVLFGGVVDKCRKLGARLVIGHGETIVEPVAQGTNRAAIEAGVDILAHPGLITEQDAAAARDRGVLLEITARKGHSLTNGHVARTAKMVGARLVFNTDSHGPGDLADLETARAVVLGAGLDEDDFRLMLENAAGLADKNIRGKIIT